MNGGLNSNGFTLMEMIIALSAILILVIAAIPPLLNSFAFGGRDVIDDSRSIVHLLSTAQSNAASSKENDNWGVKLINGGTTSCGDTAEKNCIVIYKGNDFESRDTSYDQVVQLSGANKFGTTIPNAQLKTATKDCGAAVESDGSGTIAWTSEASACGSDDSWATSNLTGSSDRTEILELTDFGFEIPSDATITGITVLIERKDNGDGACIVDYQVQLIKNGTIGGTNNADTGTTWPGADFVVGYGAGDTLWGQSFTPADINASNFGVALAAEQNTACLASIRVDNVSAYVWYTQNQPPVTDFYFNKTSGVAMNLPGNPSGLKAYFAFENSTTTDSSGNEYHGIPDAALTSSTSCAFGTECYLFNGSDQAITVPNEPIDETDKDGFTISTWVNTPDQVSGSYGIVGQSINTSWAPYSNGGMRFNASEVTQLNTCAYEQPTGSGAICNGTPTVPAMSVNEWHHIAGIFEANNRVQYLYMDGDYVDDILIQEIADYNNVSQFKIGRMTSSAGPGYFQGLIDDVRVYDRTLTSVEVNQLFDYTKPTSTLNLQAPAPIYITSGYTTSTIYVYPSGAITLKQNDN